MESPVCNMAPAPGRPRARPATAPRTRIDIAVPLRVNIGLEGLGAFDKRLDDGMSGVGRYRVPVLCRSTPDLRERVHRESGSRLGEMATTIGQSDRKIIFAEKSVLENYSSERFNRRLQVVYHWIHGADRKQGGSVLHIANPSI
jgi:hypothetical protein